MKQFHEHPPQSKLIRAGDIIRHPQHDTGTGRLQRSSPLTRFHRRNGEFDPFKCLNPIHCVKAPSGFAAPFFAFDGATRVEACNDSKKHGPDTKLRCQVYGNGVPPTDKELAELFLNLNTDVISVSSGIQLEVAVTAQRRAAVFSEALRVKLGPKFRSSVGLWNIVQRYGESIATDAVDFVMDTWDVKHEHVPMEIMRAVAAIHTSDIDSDKLRKRAKKLHRDNPNNWLLKAKSKRYQQTGQRDTQLTWTVRELLGGDPTIIFGSADTSRSAE